MFNSPNFYDTISPQEIEQYIDKYVGKEMTIAVGLIGTDGIVLATDSKLVRGTYAFNNSSKLWKLTDKLGLMSIGGFSEIRHFMINLLLQEKSKWLTPDDFMSIAIQMSNYIRAKTNEFGVDLKSLTTNLQMGYILAGYDLSSVPRIATFNSLHFAPFAPNEQSLPYFGLVDEIGRYWTKKIGLANFKYPCEFLKKFAVMVIIETIENFSDMCSEPIQFVNNHEH